MSGPRYAEIGLNQQTSSDNDELQRQERECLQALLTDEEFQRSDTGSGGILNVALSAAFSTEIFAIPGEKCDQLQEVFQTFCDSMSSSSEDAKKHLLEKFAELRSSVIRHLPSVRVVFQYPGSYPSESPPIVQLRLLEKQIEVLWKHNGRLAVMYDFYEYLRNILDEATVFPLGHCLLLIPQGAQFTQVDCANILPVHNPVTFAAQLLTYSNQREEVVFAREFHQCPVCFESHLGKNFLKLQNCGHRCCQACLKRHCETQIAEGTTWLVNCLVCQAELHPSDVSALISEEKQDKFQRLQLDTALTRMGDVVYCPRPQCNSVVIRDGDIGQCQCGFVFCTLCERSSHGIQPCYRENARESGITNRGWWPTDVSAEERDTDAEYVRDRLLTSIMETGLLANVKRCPRCVTYIQKISGCNHVVCRCGQHFCWACRQFLSSHDPYAHFRNNADPLCNDYSAGGVDVGNAAVTRAVDALVDELLPTPELWFDTTVVEKRLRELLLNVRTVQMDAADRDGDDQDEIAPI
ncbi:E3 ubiquitin-protein ligase RNF14-like isoform X2 [Paramacrobiotus metropolitanus]|uniref:E3 ubiquitin-protein ligase RNF14-like isoform X2 n=1 Tax=Paramacrobiotus metropolitanus TaxID=2943436 RepID=UPI002445BF7C|nr:E3 ubiquitin-protein ligase RNF14-like isoform X2 [Paramacrobiotus metropolitanus]